jgi:hypothetical protein
MLRNAKYLATLNGNISCRIELKTGYIASRSWEKSFKMWSIEKGTCLSTLNEQKNDGECMIEFKNGHIVSGTNDDH